MLLVVARHEEVITPVPRDRRCFICIILGFHSAASTSTLETRMVTQHCICCFIGSIGILERWSDDVEIVEARGRTAREIARWRPRVGLGCLSPIFPLYPPSQTCPVYPCRHGHSYQKFQSPKLGLHMPHIPLVFPMDIPTPSWLLPSSGKGLAVEK